jgi:hypothetical protein
LIKLLTVVRDEGKHNEMTQNVSAFFKVLNSTEGPFRVGNIASCSAEYWYFYDKLYEIEECKTFIEIWTKKVVADAKRGKMNLSWDKS